MASTIDESDQKALNALSDTRFTTYWLDSLDPVADEAALEQDTSCDLLVVGGGFCGLWAAIQAKEQDPERDVVLIEAKSVANGASGRPAAIMSVQKSAAKAFSARPALRAARARSPVPAQRSSRSRVPGSRRRTRLRRQARSRLKLRAWFMKS